MAKKRTPSPLEQLYKQRLSQAQGQYGSGQQGFEAYSKLPTDPTYGALDYLASNPTDPTTTDTPDHSTQTIDDTSGGTGGTVTTSPGALADSPEWQAFLNQLGLEQGQFEADINRQRGVASTLASQQAADITAAGGPERRNIAGGLETRGMARSGQFIRSLADQRAAEGRRQGQVQQGLTGQLSGLESQLAQKLIELQGQKSQQELQMRSQGYT